MYNINFAWPGEGGNIVLVCQNFGIGIDIWWTELTGGEKSFKR